MIQATAPGRCGIIGNPTDMYGGSLISCSTIERATCTLEDNVHGIVVEVSGERQVVTTRDDLRLVGDRLDVARAVLTALSVVPGTTAPFSLTATTNIPMQAGLAGSTAIIATITGCVAEHLKLKLNRYQMAEFVRKIEDEIMQTVCGFQDHYMAVFGGLNYLDFRGKNSAERQNAASPFATVEPLSPYVGVPIILAHSGVKHHSGTVHKSLRDRWLEGDAEAIDGFNRIEILGRLGKKALLSNDWTALAALMTENHAIVRGLGGSGDANEKLIQAALAGRATAAKLAGAGGGGTIIALTLEPEITVKALMEAGADSIHYPASSPGLTINMVSSAA
jgi:galactokinase/mevalonate kinase-like predicted kinase